MIPPSTNEMKDTKGKWRTYSLFWEHRQPGYIYKWTLKGEGTETLPSLKNIYLSYKHVPGFEYDFAMNEIGSWVHWQRLLTSGLAPVFKEWREELDVKIKAQAMKSIIKTAGEDVGASSLQAAKYLSDKGYSPLRGRPTKAEKEGRMRQDTLMNDEIEDDLKRVGLTAIKGGK